MTKFKLFLSNLWVAFTKGHVNNQKQENYEVFIGGLLMLLLIVMYLYVGKLN